MDMFHDCQTFLTQVFSSISSGLTMSIIMDNNVAKLIYASYYFFGDKAF